MHWTPIKIKKDKTLTLLSQSGCDLGLMSLGIYTPDLVHTTGVGDWCTCSVPFVLWLS